MLKCPVCGEDMVYCHGDFKVPYFRHEKNSNCPDIYSEGVTEEHINGVKVLYNWLNNQEDVSNIQLEKWIPETKQRPDIYFKYNNIEYIIEYQCSPIATKYNERHDLYRLNNIKDIWILGVNKFDIGNYNSIKNIEASIDIDSVKLKTIEMEIYNQNKHILYLCGYNIINNKKNYDIGLKTKFNIDIENTNIEKLTLENIIKNISLFKGDYIPKYNKDFERIKENIENINNYKKNTFYNYELWSYTGYENIIIKIWKNCKKIYEGNYSSLNVSEITELCNKEIDIIDNDYNIKIENENKYKEIAIRHEERIESIKEYLYEGIKNYDYKIKDIDCYYNGYGNITIRLNSQKYGNRCFRIPDTFNNTNVNLLDECIGKTIEKAKLEEIKNKNKIIKEKRKKYENEQIKSKINFHLTNNNFNIIYNEDRLRLYYKEWNIKDFNIGKRYILTHDKDTIKNRIVNLINKNLLDENIFDILISIKNRYEIISCDLHKNYYTFNCSIVLSECNIIMSISSDNFNININIFHNEISINNIKYKYENYINLKEILNKNISNLVRNYKYNIK